MQRGSFQWMKSLNKSIILNKIRTDGPISRAQIAKETKLTPPTVGSIVKELIEQSIVKESTQGISQGGRKPTMLVLNQNEFFVIGIDAGPRSIDFVLANLSGRITELVSTEIHAEINKEQFIEFLKSGIRELLEKYRNLAKKIIGIGVAMHGVVDVKTGTSLYAPNLNLRNIPIKQELEQAFDYIVKVENDARSLALGEAWFGNSSDSNKMVAVNIGRGIGAGIIINGKLYHGEFDLAGEIGHMTIDYKGKRCECGNDGCLQTVASGPAIAKRASAALKNGYNGLLAQMCKELKASEPTGEIVYQAAKEGDAFSVEILRETGKYIGVGLTNLIHMINPSKIVIGGGVSKAGSFILQPIKQTIEERALTPQAKQTNVMISKLGDHATALGAVALLLVELFEVGAE